MPSRDALEVYLQSLGRKSYYDILRLPRGATPDGVKAEVRASFDAGADGIVLSREYTEMWLANLSAAGDATRAIFAKS